MLSQQARWRSFWRKCGKRSDPMTPEEYDYKCQREIDKLLAAPTKPWLTCLVFVVIIVLTVFVGLLVLG